MTPRRSIEIPEAESGQRLDLYLARLLGISRGYVRRLLGLKRIRLGGVMPRKGVILNAGDRVEILPFHDPQDGPRAAPEVPLHVLREGEGLLAVEKPAGLPTHPLDFEETKTALNALLARYPELSGVGDGGLRSGVLHRLDTHTSGVLLFATSADAWRRARAEFAERRVQKRYLARVHGAYRGTLQIALQLDHRGRRMRVVASGGREAVTQLSPVREIGDTTLVEVRPLTGVMHQIRATLSHLGHPLLGDLEYGSTRDLGRHLLHATFISTLGFDAASSVPEVFESEL